MTTLRAKARREVRRIGDRGVIMAILGLIWIGIGVAIFVDGNEARPPGVFHVLIPHHVRGVLWIASGVAAIICARGRDLSSWGLVVLQAMPLLRFVSYLISWILWVFPADVGGYRNGLRGALIFLGLAALPMVTARIPAAHPAVVAAAEKLEEEDGR